MSKRMFQWILIVLAMISFGLSGYFIGTIMGTIAEYHEGDTVYEQIRNESVLPMEGPDKDLDPLSLRDEESYLAFWYPFLPKVDFSALKEINPDVCGWLYLPDSVIDYPVVQGKDNDYYLKHLIDGSKNANGCLFLDCKNDPLFTDDNSIIYGHHMDSGKMLAGIVKYRSQEYYEGHPSAYLLTEKAAYEIRFFSGYTTSANADAYRLCAGTKEEKLNWLRSVFDASDFYTDVTVTDKDEIVTLSTCAYDFHNARYVLHGKLIKLSE